MAVGPADLVVPVARAAQVEVADEAAEEVAQVEGTLGVSSPQTQQLDWDETSPGETRGFFWCIAQIFLAGDKGHVQSESTVSYGDSCLIPSDAAHAVR